MVDCRNVKKLLAAKHKSIAAKLFDVLEKKAKEFADNVVDEFRDMFDKLSVNPCTIEDVAEMKDYISTLQVRIDTLSEKILKNDAHYALMEVAKWQISMDQMDVRWEVFRWPHKMATEISRQEKNLRLLEVQFKKKMEEEQEDFAHDLANIQNDVGKLKELSKLGDAQKNAVTVRRIKVTLAQVYYRYMCIHLLKYIIFNKENIYEFFLIYVYK
jgi:dynein heavy chain